MEFIAWCTVFAVALYCLYWYLTRYHGYWKEVGIPYIEPVPFFGTLFDVLGTKFHQAEIKRYKKYGRIHGVYEGRIPGITVGDPDLLRDIFVKEFQIFPNRRDLVSGDDIVDKMVSIVHGEDWKRIRTIITPVFTTGKIKRMTSIIMDSAKTLCENFSKCAKNSKPIDTKKFFEAFTMDSIASAAFATKLDSHNDPNNPFVAAAKLVFRGVPWRFILFFFFPTIFKTFRISVFSPKGTGFFKEVTLQVIKDRKRTGKTRNDFLQMMLEAVDEKKRSLEKDETEKDEVQSYFKPSNDLKGLSEDELIAQCVLFFLAGYDTTAATLAFANYLLALNPECEERLIKEVDTTLSNNKGVLTYEAIQSMKYLDSVICETLRMFSPVIRLERVAEKDFVLGHTGITIPKGMVVGIPVYGIHYDSEFYPDPEKFDPDRFAPEAKAERNQYTYLPFGAGPRNCLGMRFALMQIKICLKEIFSQFRIKRCPQTKIPLDFCSSQGLLQPKEVLLNVEERTDKI